MSESENNPKNSPSRLLIYKVGNIASALICVLLCAISTLFFYDIEPGYFTSHTIPKLLYVAITISAIFALSVFCVFKKGIRLTSPLSKSATPALSIIPACAFVYFAISAATNLFGASGSHSLHLIQVILSLAAFLFFFIHGTDAQVNNNVKAVFSILASLAPITIVLISYFDYASLMNGPDNILMQFAAAMFSLYIINETRFILNRSYPRLYITVSILSTMLSLTCATCQIAIFAQSSKSITPYKLAIAVIFLLLGIYTAIRLFKISIDDTKAEEADTAPESDSNCIQDAAEQTIADSPIEADDTATDENINQ